MIKGHCLHRLPVLGGMLQDLVARHDATLLQPARAWAITRLTSGSSCPEGFSSLLRCTTGAA